MEDTGNHPSPHQQPRTMDDVELEKTYDAHAAGLFRYLISFTKCEADARDLLQDLFIKLARGEAQCLGTLGDRHFMVRAIHDAGRAGACKRSQ